MLTWASGPDVALPGALRDGNDLAQTRLPGDQTGGRLPPSAEVRHPMHPSLPVGTAGMAGAASPRPVASAAARRPCIRHDQGQGAPPRSTQGLGNLGIARIFRNTWPGDTVAFVHAFRRWTGTLPGRWRARQAARKGGERQITAPATLTASRKPGLPRHADRAIQARTSCSGQGACKDDIIRATWRCPPIRASSGQSLSCKGRRTSRAVRRISGATGVSPASSDRSMSAPAHCARR